VLQEGNDDRIPNGIPIVLINGVSSAIDFGSQSQPILSTTNSLQFSTNSQLPDGDRRKKSASFAGKQQENSIENLSDR
jgi:hypothetical protein